MTFFDIAHKIGISSEFLDKAQEVYPHLGYLTSLQNRLFDKRCSITKLNKDLTQLGAQHDLHEYWVALYLLVVSLPQLQANYTKRKIAQNIFWESIMDLRYKQDECFGLHGIHGTFVFDWFGGLFRMQRFALGRFQYDITKWGRNTYQKGDIIVPKNSPAYFCHIPSSGSLTYADRHNSYRLAYDFFSKSGLPITIFTDSWLLYPPHRDMR